MFEADSPVLTAALVFANKQVYFSLVPLLISPAVWVAGLLFMRLNRLKSDIDQAGKMLDRIGNAREFFRQIKTLDTVIGALPSLSVPWRRFRKALILPREDAASAVVRTLESSYNYFGAPGIGPAACAFYKDVAVKLTMTFAILFAGSSLAAAAFLSVAGLNFEVAGAETQVFGAFNHGFIQSGVAAVTLFVLTGIAMVVLLQNFSHLIEKGQEKIVRGFAEKLDDMIEPIDATLVAYEQTQEVRRQSQYLSIIEKRLTSLEDKMPKVVQQGLIRTPVNPPVRKESSKLMIPPNLRYEISRFPDPLEDQVGPDKKLTVKSAVRLPENADKELVTVKDGNVGQAGDFEESSAQKTETP